MVALGFRHNVAGVGEGGDPAAIEQLGVPADVIDMQMGAEHVVHIFRLHAGCGEALQIGGVEHVEAVRARAVFAVAAAGIDQDGVVLGFDHPGMDGGDEAAAFGLVVVRRQPAAVFGEDGRVPIRQQAVGGEAGTHLFFDAGDGDVTDAMRGHGGPLCALVLADRRTAAGATGAVGGCGGLGYSGATALGGDGVERLFL